MTKKSAGIAFAALALSLVAAPVQACWSNAEQDSAKIANLNQKLMVSGLRCRFGNDNFLGDYNRFVTRNNALLAGHHATIKSRYARTHGHAAANAELDKFMIGLANQYGGGVGSPDCSQLKSLAQHMSSARFDTASLAQLADQHAGVPHQAAITCNVTIAARR
jgi:hypothetical protein